jgi:hypothetical protein
MLPPTTVTIGLLIVITYDLPRKRPTTREKIDKNNILIIIIKTITRKISTVAPSQRYHL